jgi:hypothetical protein
LLKLTLMDHRLSGSVKERVMMLRRRKTVSTQKSPALESAGDF